MSIKADGIMGRSDVYQIAPEFIDVDPGWNPRTDFGDLDELADDIRANGVLNPIQVRKSAQGRFVVVNGERRLRAVRQIIADGGEFRSIPAIVVNGKISESERMYIALSTNTGKPFTVVEQGRAFQRLRAWGVSNDEISRRTGASLGTIAGRIRLVEQAAPTVLEALENKQINIAMAREIAAVGDIAQQQAALREAVKAEDISPRQAEGQAKTDAPPVEKKRVRRESSPQKSSKKARESEYDGMLCRGDVEQIIASILRKDHDSKSAYYTGMIRGLRVVIGDEAIGALGL